jgi:hypothetical protein
VPAPTADALRAGLERLESELAAAVRLADAGLGPAADLPAVFARHAAALAPDVLEQAREVAGSAELRPLAAWAVALHGRRAGAAPRRARAPGVRRPWCAHPAARRGRTARWTARSPSPATGARASRSTTRGRRSPRRVRAPPPRAPRPRARRGRGVGIADGYLATWER